MRSNKSNLENKSKEFIFPTVVTIILVMTMIYTSLFGQICKLKFANVKEKSLSYEVECNVKEMFDIEEADSALKEKTDKYISEINSFIYKKYGIALNIPEYNLFIVNNAETLLTTNDPNIGICVCIPKEHLKRDEKSLDPLIIHELFHVMTIQKGTITKEYRNKTILSELCEGYTEVLTDEFIDYMSYDYNKRIDRTGYTYYVILSKMFSRSDAFFIDYYFSLNDKFCENFERKMNKNALASKYFNSFNKFESSLVVMNISDNKKDIEYSFYSSLEMMMYYLKSEPSEDKIYYKQCLDEIFDWYEKEYVDESSNKQEYEENKSYLYNIIDS